MKFTAWVPIYVLFFLSKQLSFTQIFMLSIVAAITQIVFEVPSGIFADFFGRGNSLVIGAAARVASMLFYLFGHSFTPFAFGYVFMGVSLAFQSGADSAFLYDSLKDIKQEHKYKKIEGKAFGISMIAMSVGALIGGSFAKINFLIPIWLTFGGYVISVFIALSFHEPKHHKKDKDKKYFKHLIEATKFVWNHPKVKWLTLFSAAVTAALVISHKFSQPYFILAKIDLGYFGIIFAVTLMSSAITAYFAHKIEEKLGEKWSLLSIAVLNGIHLIILGLYVGVFGILLFLLNEMIWGFTSPVIKDYINRHVESHHRATVLSLGGFLMSMFIIIISPLIGYIADVFSITTALFWEGVIMLIICVPMVFKIKGK